MSPSENMKEKQITSGTTGRRRPVPGKGHRKSRKGCVSCKGRHVKCSEELPTCRGCRRLGLECRYAPPPALPSVLRGVSQVVAAPSSSSSSSLKDLFFFHHFLIEAHPPLPFGHEGVWQEVAAMSHEVIMHNTFSGTLRPPFPPSHIQDTGANNRFLPSTVPIPRPRRAGLRGPEPHSEQRGGPLRRGAQPPGPGHHGHE